MDDKEESCLQVSPAIQGNLSTDTNKSYVLYVFIGVLKAKKSLQH